jgi:hypothetical protein
VRVKRPFGVLLSLASVAVSIVVALQVGVGWGVAYLFASALWIVTRLDLWD